MCWDDMCESNNVEDECVFFGGGFGGGGMWLGIGGIVIVVVVGLLMGKNLLEIFSMVM